MQKTFFLLLVAVGISTSVYDFDVQTIDGGKAAMANFQGRKVMFVTIPSSRSAEDTIFLKHIDSIALVNAASLQVVAIPSMEDKWSKDSLQLVKIWYRQMLVNGVIISKPVFTRRSSNSRQNELLQWLTRSDRNSHFDTEIEGPGMMFFINETGELYGVAGPEAKYSKKFIQRMLQ